MLFLDDPTCALNWPNNSHHILYRSSWCKKWHNEWLASQVAEERPWIFERTQWPFVRDIPLGFGEDFESRTAEEFALTYGEVGAAWHQTPMSNGALHQPRGPLVCNRHARRPRGAQPPQPLDRSTSLSRVASASLCAVSSASLERLAPAPRP